jgi:hypothetical protein
MHKIYISLVVAKRLMAPGVTDIEGSTHGHDVIPVKAAINYFKGRGFPDTFASSIYDNIKPAPNPFSYQGSTKETGANRVVFGEAVNKVLDKLSKEEAAKKVMVIDSTSIRVIRFFGRLFNEGT